MPSTQIRDATDTDPLPVTLNSTLTFCPALKVVIGLVEANTVSLPVTTSYRLSQRLTPLVPNRTRAWYDPLPAVRSANETVEPLPDAVIFSGQTVALSSASTGAEPARVCVVMPPVLCSTRAAPELTLVTERSVVAQAWPDAAVPHPDCTSRENASETVPVAAFAGAEEIRVPAATRAPAVTRVKNLRAGRRNERGI